MNDGEGSARAVMRVARWLDKALSVVERDGVCLSYGVGVHVAGADCEHEVPAAGPKHGGG